MQERNDNEYLAELARKVNELDPQGLERMMRFAIVREDHKLMWAIAKAENTSNKTLRQLANYEVVAIQSAVGSHRNSGEQTLEVVANSPFWEARCEAARNEHTPEDCLRNLLLEDPIKEVREAARKTLEELGVM